MGSSKTQQKQGEASPTSMDAASTLDSTAGAAEPVKCAAAAAAAIAAWENKRDKFDQSGHVRFQVCSSLPQNSYRDKKQRGVQHSFLNIPA